VGCHPSLVGAHTAFNVNRFARLIERTAFVSEVGLDGKSRVPMSTQQATLDAILSTLQRTPRVTSLHSFEASEEVLRALESRPIKGAVLHWWLGDMAQTRRAVDLGCFFSVNASSVRRSDLLDVIPLDRVLTETDHPFGDRWGEGQARPGGVADVERILAGHYGVSDAELRSAMWANLGRLAALAGCADSMPWAIRVGIAST
jgi:TatD DNase family protein